MKPGESNRERQDPRRRLRFEDETPEDVTSGHVGPMSKKRRYVLPNKVAAAQDGAQAVSPPDAPAPESRADTSPPVSTESRADEPSRAVPSGITAEQSDTPTQSSDASPLPVSRPNTPKQSAPTTSGQLGPKLKQGALYQMRHTDNRHAEAAPSVSGGNTDTSGKHDPKSKKQRCYQSPKDETAAQTPPPPNNNVPENSAATSPPAPEKVQDAAANPATPDNSADASASKENAAEQAAPPTYTPAPEALPPPHTKKPDVPGQSAPATSGHVGPKSAQGGGKLRQESRQARPSDRLRHEDTPQGGSTDPGGASKEAKKAAREGKRLEQSKFRMEKSGEKLDAAREKLAAQKPPTRKGPVKALESAAAGGVASYAHGKIFEVERENVGTESAHRTELVGESAVRSASRRFRSRSNRVRKLERRELHAKSDYAYRQLKQEHPELKKKPLSRAMQKQRIKRQYQKQARTAAKQGAKGAKRTVNAAGKAARAVVNFIKRNPKILLIALIGFLLVIVLQSCVAAFTSIGNGLFGGAAGTSYLAEDTEIDSVEAAYLNWETLITFKAQNAASAYPGYDEYRYNIDPTGHDPYSLISFLTAVYNDFTYSVVESVLQEIFNEQYTLTFTPEVETRYRTETHSISYTDEDGNEQTDTYDVEVPYDYYILNVELTARPFTDSLYSRMTAEQLERYNVLMITKGNRELNPLYFT